MKRTNKEVLKDILKALSDNKPHSPGDLERKVNTNWLTIRDHIEELYLFEAIEVVDHKVKITSFGTKIWKKIK